MKKLTPKRFLFEVKADVVSKLTAEAMKGSAPHPLVRTLWTVGAIRRHCNATETLSLPPLRLATLWYYGFEEGAAVAYDFDEHHPTEFISDYEQMLTRYVDGEWDDLLGNKLIFHRALERFDDRRPTIFGLLAGGRFHHVDGDAAGPPSDPRHRSDGGRNAAGAVALEAPAVARDASERRSSGEAVAETEAVLKEVGKLILKPVAGAEGEGVVCVEYRDGDFSIDYEPASRAEFVAQLSRLDGYLVSEFAEQAGYAERLYPHTTNTVRAMTMWDAEAGEPFIAMAVQRIGSSASVPVDNHAKGGLAAGIDLRTGELGRAEMQPTYDRLEWYDRHPDTDEPITGVRIPDWDRVCESVLEMAAALPFVPYIAWDIVVRDGGDVTVVEANHWGGVRIQTHGPLLSDPRVRRFFREHNVVAR